MKNISFLTLAVTVIFGIFSGCNTTTGMHAGHGSHGAKIGAPSKGMSSSDYQQLVRLEPQNTMMANFSAV